MASYGLEGPRLAPPRDPLAPADWNRLVAAVRRERQAGALAWAIADGWWPATDEQQTQALDLHRRAMAGVLRIEETLLDLDDDARTRGVDLVVLKGPAVARLDHVQPSVRSFADLDLLVRGEDLAAVEELLTAQGGTRRFPEPRSGFDRRFSKGLSVRLPDGIEVDVHRTLALGPFGLRIRPDGLVARTERLEVGGAQLRALDRRGRFLHACVHAALGASTPAMTARRDIVAIVGASPDPEPLVAAIELAEAWDLGLVVSWAIHDAATTFDWCPPPVIRARLDRIRPSARERRWLSGYHGERSSARHALDSVAAIDGWSDRARYAFAVVAPRGQASFGRVTAAARELRSR